MTNVSMMRLQSYGNNFTEQSTAATTTTIHSPTCHPLTTDDDDADADDGELCVYTECAAGSYGQDCESRCHCRNSAECHPVTGECICGPGWHGDACDQRQSPLPCLSFTRLRLCSLCSYSISSICYGLVDNRFTTNRTSGVCALLGADFAGIVNQQ